MHRTGKTTAKIRPIVRRIGGGLLAGAFLSAGLVTPASADVARGRSSYPLAGLRWDPAASSLITYGRKAVPRPSPSWPTATRGRRSPARSRMRPTPTATRG